MGADMSCTAARKGKHADVVISRESVREAVQSARSQRRASRLFSGLSEEGNAYIKDHDVEAQLAGAVRLLAAERPRNAAAFLSRVLKDGGRAARTRPRLLGAPAVSGLYEAAELLVFVDGCVFNQPS